VHRSGTGSSSVAYVFGALHAAAVPGPVLISLLDDLGIAETASRTALSRLVRAGSLTSSKCGRVAIYRMQGGYRELFLRIRSSDEPPDWDGYFQSIIYDIPETQRRDRDALRERAIEAGFGMPRPGFLIGFSEPTEWCAAWMNRADLFVEHAVLACSPETASRLASRAWDLAACAATAQQLVDRLDRIQRNRAGRITDPRQAFVVYHGLMANIAPLVRRVPTLPPEITPAGWPGSEIPTRLTEISRLLGPMVDEHAESTAKILGLTDLVEPL
jgi:phenylacetic acid degradation operon negative regulatory protein